MSAREKMQIKIIIAAIVFNSLKIKSAANINGGCFKSRNNLKEFSSFFKKISLPSRF